VTAPDISVAARLGSRALGRLGGIPTNPVWIPAPPERLRILLVEDDPGDAFLVRELLAEAEAPVDVQTAQTMDEALGRLAGVHCVLLDLGLPDASGLDALRRVLQEAAGVAVCVLTGLEDEYLGIAAVGEGAQDYLVKGKVDGVLLSRALRYAVERKRADENTRRLREVELRQAESARLERGLLPQPILDDAPVSLVSFYQPGRDRALLGGDFYDAVATSPNRLHLLVGDVCGHGVDEAPLGVALRVAWRALVLAQVPDDSVLPSLEQVLVSERRSEELFATVVMVTLDLTTGLARVRVAGHPPPLVLSPSGVLQCEVEPALVLGVLRGASRPATDFQLTGSDWSLLLYTDGLIEGFATGGEGRLGAEGLIEMLAESQALGVPERELPSWLMGRAEEHNGGALADDVAILLLTPGAPGAPSR
jgi:serine phosphatase RsbU (regulator of sigma subunit)